MSATSPNHADYSIWTTVAVATLVAGSLDILYAIILVLNRSAGVEKMLRFIASGPIPPATTWGVVGAFVGLLTHFALMAIMAAVFLVAASRIPDLIQKPVKWGILYGIATYVVMNFVVMPLRFDVPLPSRWPLIITYLFPHIVLVGIPIALISAWAAQDNREVGNLEL